MPTAEQQEIALLRREINRLKAQVDQLYSHLNLTFVENTSENDDPQVVAALKAGNVMEAIRLYREKTKLGLAAAQAGVDEMRARLGY
jgi:ribosomal protein L7/L12